MNISFALILAANLAAATYLGVRVYVLFGAALPQILHNKFVFALFVFLFTQCALIVIRFLPLQVPAWLSYITYTFTGLYLIGFSVMFMLDTILLLSRLFHFHQIVVAYPLDKVYLVVVGLFYLLGLYNTLNTHPTNYTLTYAQAGKDFRIVEITDVHVTNFTRPARLQKLVRLINEQKPDVVIFAGDTIDGAQKPFNDKNVAEIFRGIESTYGVYGVLGNHEYYGEGINTAEKLLRSSGIVLLVDESVYIPELNLSIIGRDDLRSTGFRRKSRKTANELVSKLTKNSLVLVADHQPQRADEAMNAGVALQLSGHTHNGQLIPANIVVKFIYEKAYGLLNKEQFNLITSCGYGTWGPPMRIGSRSEIVVVDIKATNVKP
ncbi:hypothetical protein RsTz2092_05510 [Deferribacterales bacterium RsTz2092]|nr:hypothetical protein AGMMS49941_11550 [Deferribacterales bacterium]